MPEDSDTGARVVYGLKDRRVWIVDDKEETLRTFPVMPSSVSPLPGVYTVSSRSGTIKGSDGVLIEHVVRFANVDDVSVGFSAAQDGSMKSPDPTMKTGGVRMKRADGDVLWTFATVGVKVVVVP
ncbi:putative secreted protein [Streptomyces sp. PAMC 26508]|nr:putative secreted protein [Streptomyces sp. PAMC 26508]